MYPLGVRKESIAGGVNETLTASPPDLRFCPVVAMVKGFIETGRIGLPVVRLETMAQTP